MTFICVISISISVVCWANEYELQNANSGFSLAMFSKAKRFVCFLDLNPLSVIRHISSWVSIQHRNANSIEKWLSGNNTRNSLLIIIIKLSEFQLVPLGECYQNVLTTFRNRTPSCYRTIAWNIHVGFALLSCVGQQIILRLTSLL